MSTPINLEALNTIFLEARTHNAWLPKPVDDDLLRRIYEIARLGPTSANTSPMRAVFVKSPVAKGTASSRRCHRGTSIRQWRHLVTAIAATDFQFHQHVPKLWPHNPGFAEIFTKPGQEEFPPNSHAFRNATLQGAYLIIAARAASGWIAGRCRASTMPRSMRSSFGDLPWKSNFLINIGYGEASQIKPWNPRLSFDEACRIV